MVGDGSGNRGGRVFVNSEGRVVMLREEEEEGDDDDVMKALTKAFKYFPALVSGLLLGVPRKEGY